MPTMFLGLWRDLMHAARSLMRARAFTFVCVVSLGIGMAPVIAVPYGMRIFTTPPAGVDLQGFVEVVTTPLGSRAATDEWSYPDFVELRDAETGLDLVGWVQGSSDVTLPGSGGTRVSIPSMFVSPAYFETIGVTLAAGAGFGGAAGPAVIIGHDFWWDRLAGDPDALGKPITIDGTVHIVVGIAPEAFDGHMAMQGADLFLPLERHPALTSDAGARTDRGREWIRIHGRLQPDVEFARASAAVSAVTTRLARQHPATNENKAGGVAAYHPIGSLESSELTIVRTVGQTLALIPLLVVCLNISGMVQVRSAMRERELSIRQAIGATRRRLAQHLLTEALLLAALGAALASVVLFNITSVASWWVGQPLPPRLDEALSFDLSMLAICVVLCLAATLVCGWLPAVRFSRPAILSVLKDEAGVGGVRAGRIHRVTAALQVALAVPLLVLSGVSLDRVRATATSDLGFDADVLYAAPLPLGSQPDAYAVRVGRARDILERASGVDSVTVADGLPLDFRYRTASVSLAAPPGAVPRAALAHVTRVGDGFLETMGISLIRGREFAPADIEGAERVTIISESLASELFPNADPGTALGTALTFREQALTIVGVTADFPTSQMSTERPQLLVPLAQHPDVRRDAVAISDDLGTAPRLMMIARAAAGVPPAQLTAGLEAMGRELDPQFDPARIVSGAWLRRNSMDDFLTQSAVSGISGGVILLLSALGVYGVVGLMVATRTREIAVRVALGASPAQVVSMIVLDVVKLVSPGVGVGLLVAAALVRLNGGILGVPLSNLESLAYVTGAAIALAIAALASLPPARRAASVEPMVAMRST